MHDPELANRGIQMLGLGKRMVETLTWMITHFNYERENQQWGNESKEIKDAKRLKKRIEKLL